MDLTPGPSEVQSILAVDALKGVVYYLATAPGEPNQRNLYSVALNASEKPTCTSCGLLTPEGESSKSQMSANTCGERVEAGKEETGDKRGRDRMIPSVFHQFNMTRGLHGRAAYTRNSNSARMLGGIFHLKLCRRHGRTW